MHRPASRPSCRGSKPEENSVRWPILFVGATLALSITFSKGTAFAQGTSDCEPSCRSGYVCSSGQCVSACNPPCASSEKCTADARCISRSSTTAAPPTSQPIAESHTGTTPDAPATAPPVSPTPARAEGRPSGVTSIAGSGRPTDGNSDRLVKARRAKFSALRYVVEILVSGTVGSATSYGIYAASCGDAPCLGGAFGGMAANIALTPLVAFGVGEAMGGDGSLASTYLLGLAGFAPFPAASDDSAIVILAIGMVLEPFLAPLGYELSSHIKAKSQLGTLGAIRFRSTPLSGARGELRGGTFSVGAEF